MNKYQTTLIILSAILAIGVFLPLVTIPFIGEINYYMNGKGDGRYILLCAALAAILALTKYKKLACIPGVIALIILGYFFINMQDSLTKMNELDTKELGVFSAIVEGLKSSVSVNYGFIVMFIAALGLTFLPISISEKEERGE